MNLAMNIVAKFGASMSRIRNNIKANKPNINGAFLDVYLSEYQETGKVTMGG